MLNVRKLYFTVFITSLIFLVVALGALTRLLDAGLGCPDWPGCYGWLMPPIDEQQIQHAQKLFPAWPLEYQKALMEMIHRYFATVLGTLIIFQAWYLRKAPRLIKTMSLVMVFFVIIQGAFGAWTVTMKLWPPVVTAHLLGGFLLLMIQCQLLVKIKHVINGAKFNYESVSRYRKKHPKNLFFAMSLASSLLLLQIILGGWTSSHYAGLVCPDFPTCQTLWWPNKETTPWIAPWPEGQQAVGGLLNMENRMAIHMTHRYLAFLLLLAELYFLGILIKARPDLKKWIILVFSTLSLQIVLGISNVVYHLPLFLALLHNIGAALLWATHWALVAHLADSKETEDVIPNAYT